MSRKAFLLLGASCALLLAAHGLSAQVSREGNDPLSLLAFSDARLRPAAVIAPIEASQASLAAEARVGWTAFQAGSLVRWQAYVDRRTGHLESAVGGGIPWIPGTGNSLAGPPADLKGLEAAARAFLPRVAPMLGVDPASLVLNPGRSGRQADHLWYADFDIQRGGMTVEGARVVFRVSNGNLIEIGAESLPSPGAAVPTAQVGREKALAALSELVHGFSAADFFSDGGSLHLLPVSVANPRFPEGYEPGNGRGLGLVWEFVFHRRGVTGTWRARVDAVTGEVAELVDTNLYGRVTGGAFPLSPTTTPEAELPMPYADVFNAGFTDGTGFYSGTGPVTTKLDGQYVKIVDSCGLLSKTSDWAGIVDFGASGGTDCATPGTGGNGNTHAARTQYYHVNRIKEVGRAWLPGNAWLQSKLTVNVNLNQTCNAYWDNLGMTINFFKSGGGCGNTGEISSVSLHEYGHGLDQNDGNGTAPDNGTGETYGDFTSALMTHNSCIGPGFLTVNCGGYSDACTACTGVRDIDWAKHTSGTPATVGSFTQTHCPSRPTYAGPCGMEGHCESYVSSEALWDFAARDLPDPGSAAAWTITERLWYLSRSTATGAFTCSKATSPWTSDGCATGSLWRTLRAADDDDGDLTNGTPHSCQLFAAFNRHGIACASDPGANVCFSGCTPPAGPALTLTPGAGQVQVAWSSSGGSTVYDVYRSELGCGSGFVRIADSVAGTLYTDTAVAGGLPYSYQVVAHPTSGTACAAAPTACQSATPTTPVCTPPVAPTGLSVTSTSISRVDLSWAAVGGAAGYNVYRAAAAAGPYALIATVTPAAFSDLGLTGNSTYFYKVRSFANACESVDSAVLPASTSACTTVSLYKSTFETGSGLADWTKQVLSGGSATNDWRGIQVCSPAKSGSHIFRFGGSTCTAQYGTGEVAVAAPPAVAVPATAGNTRLSFWHRRDFEPRYDGGRVAAALDGGNLFYFGPDSALSGETYDNVIAGPGTGTCPPGGLGGVSSFSGTKTSLTNTVVDLDAICNAGLQGTSGCSGHSVQPGFLSISDCFQGGAGWFIDDVEVTACVPVAAAMDYYTLTPCRLIDTRNAAGPLGGPALAAGDERNFTVTGTCGIPATAKALSINLTVVAPGAAGYLQVLPANAPATVSSSLNFAAGETRANNALVPLSLLGTGALVARSGTSVPVDFVIDVTGYFQ
jgi:hypothetical protein